MTRSLVFVPLVLAVLWVVAPGAQAQTPTVYEQVSAEAPLPKQLPEPPAEGPNRIPTEPRLAPIPMEVVEPLPPPMGKWHHGHVQDYVSLEGLYFSRTAPPQISTSFFELHDELALSTKALELGWVPGWRVTRGWRITDADAIEATYFGVQAFSAHAQAESTEADLSSFFVSGFGPGTFLFDSFDQARVHTLDLESALHNFELNYLHMCVTGKNCGAALILGLRGFYIHEKLEFTSFDEPEPAFGSYLIKTDNILFGPQVGAEASYSVERARLILHGKITLCGNAAEQQSVIINNGEVVRTGTARQSHFAPVAECGLRFSSQLAPCCEFSIGYELLAIGGLALAPDQLDFFDGAHSQSSINITGFAVYHGLSGGIRFSW
jgi:hypothetical protein